MLLNTTFNAMHTCTVTHRAGVENDSRAGRADLLFNKQAMFVGSICYMVIM